MNTIKTITTGLLSLLAISSVDAQKVKFKTKDGVPVIKIKDDDDFKVKNDLAAPAYVTPTVKVKNKDGYAVAKVKKEHHYASRPKVKHKTKDGYPVVKTKSYGGYKSKRYYHYDNGRGRYYRISNGNRIYYRSGWKP
jgi:hypothetical protein